jgi:hypothetical protein
VEAGEKKDPWQSHLSFDLFCEIIRGLSLARVFIYFRSKQPRLKRHHRRNEHLLGAGVFFDAMQSGVCFDQR